MADNWYAHQVGGGIIIILHCAAASGAICLMCCARGSTFAIMITVRATREEREGKEKAAAVLSKSRLTTLLLIHWKL